MKSRLRKWGWLGTTLRVLLSPLALLFLIANLPGTIVLFVINVFTGEFDKEQN